MDLESLDSRNRLKKHESPRSQGRNSKGKLSAARLRQLKKSKNNLRKRLSEPN